MGESDGLSFNVECAVNRLNLTSEQAGFSGQSLSVPNGIPLFLDGSVHQFVVPTIPDTPVSLIARDNQVYELFFQLAHPGQQLTGEYNHYAYSTNSDAPHTSVSVQFFKREISNIWVHSHFISGSYYYIVIFGHLS